MLYFKNSELAYTHHVSVRTVRNWIEAAKQGKLDLDLHTHAGRQYVSNTARNLSTIERMVEDRKKFRPHRAVKTVTPKPEFYKLFNESQVYDIVKNLEIYKEIPHQYSYFNGGAKHFDDYANRMFTEETPNTLTSTIKLLNQNRSYIDELLKGYDRVNIVDLGVGNALPVRDLIQHLIDQSKMGRYIAIDDSLDMIAIAKKNLREWFGEKFDIEEYDYDINFERFGNILAEEYIQPGSNKTMNLVLFLGGTLSSSRSPSSTLQTIHSSMDVNDLLIHSQKLDSVTSRRYFDFNIADTQQSLPPQDKFIVDMLNIEKSLYDVVMGFDEVQRQRHISIRLKLALTVDFKFGNGKRSVSFNKGDSILLWRALHKSALNMINELSENNFYPLQTSQTGDQEYLLTISRIKKEAK